MATGNLSRVAMACAFAIFTRVALAQSPVIRFDGLGPVRIGMSLPALNRALHMSAKAPTDPDDKSCYYVDVPKSFGAEIMMVKGVVARIDIGDASLRTSTGVHLGDSERHVQRAYGSGLKVEPEAYDPEHRHTLTIHSTNHADGIRFVTENGKVMLIYVGRADAILLIEGCE